MSDWYSGGLLGGLDSGGDSGAGGIDQMVQALMKNPQIDGQYNSLMQTQQPSSVASPSGTLGDLQASSKKNFMNPMGGLIGMLGKGNMGLLGALGSGSPGGLMQALQQSQYNPNIPASATTPSSSPTGQMPPIA